MVKDMTEGKPLKLILNFCIPLIIGNLFQQLYNIADSIIVGQILGKDALAAVGSTGSLNFLVIGFVLGMCGGFCIPVAHSFGAANYKLMRRFIFNAAYLSAITAIIFAIATGLTAGNILQIMQTPDNIYEQARIYITIIFFGIPATVFYNILSGILRALGDSKTPLYFLIIAACINIVLDVVFILFFNSGVAGAAIATVIAQVISGLLCLFYVMKKYPILRPESVSEETAFNFSASKRLILTGLPMALQFSITALGTIVLQSAVNTLGSDAVAAITSAQKIQMLVTLPMETIGLTLSTYCSQNLGAGKIDRIRTGIRQATILEIVYCIAAFIIMATLGSYCALLFISPEEIALLDQIALFLRINGAFYITLGLIFLFRNSIQGMGFGFGAMTAGIFEMVARALVAFFIVGKFGYFGVCFANPAAWIAADILLIPLYFYVMKKISKSHAN